VDRQALLLPVDRVAFIDKDRLLAVESPRALGRLIAENERIDFEGPEAVAEMLSSLIGVTSVIRSPLNSYRVEVRDKEGSREALRLLVDSGITLIRTSTPSLEEVYIQLMGDRGLKV
jgi:ABC-2 type transport system ATP-binding protein